MSANNYAEMYFFCIKIFLHYLLRILSRMWNYGGKDRNVSKFLAKLFSNKLKLIGMHMNAHPPHLL